MKKRKKKDAGDRKRIVRSPEDTASASPPEITVDAATKKLYRVCALPWEALKPTERAAGLTEAESVGADFARDWEDQPSPRAWAETIAVKAFQYGVINDIEFDMWRLMPENGDLRLTAFMLGCIRWRLRYPGKGGKIARAERIERETRRAAKRIMKQERKSRGQT